MNLERRLRLYCTANGRLPNCMEAVKASDEDEESVFKNAWGGPIEYSVTNGTVATLITSRLCGPEPRILQEFVLRFDASMRSPRHHGKDRSSKEGEL